MRWPTIEALTAAMSLPDGVSLRLLREGELSALPALILSWYPTVSVGSESVFCDPEFLRRAVVREGYDADLFAFVIEQGNEVVGFMSFERQPAALTLHARLGLLAPAARAGFLGALGFLLFERLGELTGAELLLSWVTLASQHQQRFARRRGFMLTGVVPGFDRDLQADGRVARVTEALYAKVLAPGSLLDPDPAQLTPEVGRLLALVKGDR